MQRKPYTRYSHESKLEAVRQAGLGEKLNPSDLPWYCTRGRRHPRESAANRGLLDPRPGGRANRWAIAERRVVDRPCLNPPQALMVEFPNGRTSC